ncbi:(Lyso)-N-acylphosphatidylethanolamine lipase [Cloeon dipterum]|uniref:(Lyso)-N-acylphosphatidylethanolamine lipase n=1 Tax=Cloeon dipterum TaxID=197152 RepID=UPI00321F97C7
MGLTPENNEVVQESWFWSWFKWSPVCPNKLRQAEKSILSVLKTEYRGFYVDIGPAVGSGDKIWTLSLNEHSQKTPLVMLHGMGSGSALWVLNLDAISKDRPVYCIDLLGFARSTRPTFSSDPEIAEKQMVQSIEAWRQEVRLNDMILLGHSLGAFLATSYAISYPDRVKHLILADPWGFPERPRDVLTNKVTIPIWVKAVAFVLSPLNPLWAIRVSGPLGPWLIQKARPDILRKFEPVLGNETHLVGQYIYQCNAQNPSGESAFHALMTGFGWAKRPMVNRIQNLRGDVPMSVLYGSRSWVDSAAGELIREKRPENAIVNIQIISGAGHHVYADRSETFNRIVLEAMEKPAHLFRIEAPPQDQEEDAEEAAKTDKK